MSEERLVIRSSGRLLEFYKVMLSGEDYGDFRRSDVLGLCSNLKYFMLPGNRHSYPLDSPEWEAMEQVSAEMLRQFEVAGLDPIYPFNTSANYLSEMRCYDNPFRVQWLKDRIEDGLKGD